MNKIIIIAILLLVSVGCQPQNKPKDSVSADSTKSDSITGKNPEIQKKTPSIIKEIPLPEGYSRTESSSVADFFRNLELKTENNTVFLYDGSPKYNQTAQYAVLTTDVGKRDLQQCADAVMRLRAEYLYEQKQYDAIHFNFLSDGKARHYNNYAKGDRSRKKFRRYMDYIFSYANTSSLKNELLPVNESSNIQIGDVFIQKGRPYGHAITVVDIAVHKTTEAKIFMVCQSYMPAQDIHILKNPNDFKLSPWYKVEESGSIITPEWKFYWSDLMRFGD